MASMEHHYPAENGLNFTNTLVIKAALGEDIRKVPISNFEITKDELLCMFQRIFKGRLSPADDITLKYKDEDGDLVTIDDDSDLAFAIRCCRSLKLTLFVNGEPRRLESDEVKYMRKELKDIRDTSTRLLDQLDSFGPDVHSVSNSICDGEVVKEPSPQRAPKHPEELVSKSREFDPLNRSQQVAPLVTEPPRPPLPTTETLPSVYGMGTQQQDAREDASRPDTPGSQSSRKTGSIPDGGIQTPHQENVATIQPTVHQQVNAGHPNQPMMMNGPPTMTQSATPPPPPATQMFAPPPQPGPPLPQPQMVPMPQSMSQMRPPSVASSAPPPTAAPAPVFVSSTGIMGGQQPPPPAVAAMPQQVGVKNFGGHPPTPSNVGAVQPPQQQQQLQQNQPSQGPPSVPMSVGGQLPPLPQQQPPMQQGYTSAGYPPVPGQQQQMPAGVPPMPHQPPQQQIQQPPPTSIQQQQQVVAPPVPPGVSQGQSQPGMGGHVGGVPMGGPPPVGPPPMVGGLPPGVNPFARGAQGGMQYIRPTYQ